ncbi:MAG: O-antigen ligase domain-containing protein [Gammaproteobacteria bacterium]|nr:MAG: O-antigen ligase domain-containing protein [Gammaproteobacteria bacterium]
MTAERTLRTLEITGLVLLALLFAVWPVAHTISLRDLLLVLVLLLFGYLVWRARPAMPWRELVWLSGLYAALTLWIVVVALFISEETAWSLGEIRGQWLKGLFAMLAGGLAALALARTPGGTTRAIVVVFGVLLAHTLYTDAVTIRGIFEAWLDPEGRLVPLVRHIGISPDSTDYGYLTLLRHEWKDVMLTDGPDKSNLLSNLLLYLLLAEFFVRFVHHRRLLPFSGTFLFLALAAVLFSLYIERARNGFAELIVVLLLLGGLLLHAYRGRLNRRTLGLGIAVLLMLPFAIGYISYKTDPRWQSLWQTVPIAFDTQSHKAWMDQNKYSMPFLPSGEQVSGSNYLRLARAKVSLEFVREHPWGMGFGRNIFGHAVKRKYGENPSHSHSGLIDMALGTGIPGVLLWGAFLASIGYVAGKAYVRARSYSALLLVLLVTSYSVRMVLDSIIRDHMLQMFLFLAAFLAVAAVRTPDDKTVPAA